jgi:hypothetical protein
MGCWKTKEKMEKSKTLWTLKEQALITNPLVYVHEEEKEDYIS